MTAVALVQKLWNYCKILRDNGLTYGEYVEQLTFLFFLKMADEQNLEIFWLKDNTLEDCAYLLAPGIFVADLGAALKQIAAI